MDRKIVSRKEAKKLGLKRYFTGKPCKNGHISDRFYADCHCVQCCHDKSKKFRIKNGEYDCNRKKKYYKENKDCMSLKRKVYIEKNKTYLAAHTKEYKSKPARYGTYAIKLIGHECMRDNNGCIVTRCKKCNSWFTPTVQQVSSRVQSIEGKRESLGSENNLYCSQKCKESCAVFKRVSIPKHLAATTKQLRCNQRVNKKSLLEIQDDQCGYNFCEKCGVKTKKLEIHHSIMISEDHREADNMAHQLLLCGACHKKPEAHCR